MKRKESLAKKQGRAFPRLAKVMTCLMLMLTGLGTGVKAQSPVTYKATQPANDSNVKAYFTEAGGAAMNGYTLTATFDPYEYIYVVGGSYGTSVGPTYNEPVRPVLGF